jgi:hypothetical protein
MSVARSPASVLLAGSADEDEQVRSRRRTTQATSDIVTCHRHVMDDGLQLSR